MQSRIHNFQPRCVTVSDYVQKVKSGQYDINPEFQRDGYKPTKWKQAVIAHHCQFGTVPTLYYHHNFDKNCKENLDGKQRTLAFMDYMDNKFSIPKLPGVPDDMCCRYNELSQKNKMLFDESVIIITVTDSQLSADEIKTFFKNVQKSSDTTPGERLNANTSSFVTKFVKDRLPQDRHIFERINFCKNDKRKRLISAVMRYMYLMIVPNGLVRKYEPETNSVDKWSTEFSEDDIDTLEEAYQSVLLTADFLHKYNVKNAHIKYVFGSFFRFLNNESSINISKLIEKIGDGDGDVFSEYSVVCSGDTHSTSYDRYKYLVNVFIK